MTSLLFEVISHARCVLTDMIFLDLCFSDIEFIISFLMNNLHLIKWLKSKRHNQAYQDKNSYQLLYKSLTS